MVKFPQPPRPLFTLTQWLKENAIRDELARRRKTAMRDLVVTPPPTRSQLNKVPKDRELTLEEWVAFFSGKPVTNMPRRP